jgi:predicted Zn-dependent peptidase
MIGGAAYAGGRHAARTQQRAPEQAPDDLTGQLIELAKLKEAGALTEDEFTAAKQKLLSS